MNIEINPFTPALKYDYLYLFDNMVHKENPEWSICYCYDYHFLGDVATCTREMSRSAVSQLIEDGKQTGYLAYHQGKPVGWCNINNRNNLPRLIRDYEVLDNPKDNVWSVVCFIIHPDYRRQGIVKQFLERIIQDFPTTNYNFIEAYPKKTSSASASDFRGTLRLYQGFGFEIEKEHDNYYVVRKTMQ